MRIKDNFGTVINVVQAKNGKIIVPIANKFITLSKEDAESFTLYDIEDFNLEAFNSAYHERQS